jgi:hypothetical protein
MKKIVIIIIICSLLITVATSCHTEAKKINVYIEEKIYNPNIKPEKPYMDQILMETQKNTKIEKIKKSLTESISKLKTDFGLNNEDIAIVVMISIQRMFLIRDNSAFDFYPISTSKYGVGNSSGSNKTPLGVHQIQAKIGDDAPIGAIFKGKVFTGEIAEISYAKKDITDDDYVTTRVLPLRGLEEGINKGKGIDSFSRAIYIHGTPEEGLIGKPASHGCIRMLNKDVIELFNKVEVGTLLDIIE